MGAVSPAVLSSTHARSASWFTARHRATRYEPSVAQPGHETYARFLAVTGLQSQRPAHAEV